MTGTVTPTPPKNLAIVPIKMSPLKTKSFTAVITPTKGSHSSVEKNELQVHFQQDNELALDNSPNKIPCSQVLRVKHVRSETSVSRIAAARGLFGENATFNNCSFTFN